MPIPLAPPATRIDTMLQMLHDHGVADSVTMLSASFSMCDAHVGDEAFRQVLANMVMPDGTEAPGCEVQPAGFGSDIFLARIFLDKEDVHQVVFGGTHDEVAAVAPSAFARWANAQVQPDPTHLL